MVLKRLKLLKFFNGVARTFPTHKHMGVGRGPGILNFQQKMLFSLYRVVKTKFHHFWSPVEKLLEKSTSGPPWKNSFRRPCTQACKIFVKNCVVLHHLATLFNNTNAVINP